MNDLQRRMVGHGAVIMLIGLLAGFALLMSLIGGFELYPGRLLAFELPGDGRAWARAHTGGLMNGMMVMIVALLLWAMELPERTARQLYWMLVGAGYSNTVFYWAGPLAPGRALTFGDNRLGESSVAGVIGLLPAYVFAFVLLFAMFILARQCFASPDR